MLIHLICSLILVSSSIEFDQFQVQHQPVSINRLEPFYVTNEQYFLHQTLYRNDQLQLACDCIAMNNEPFRIVWSINDRIESKFDNRSSIEVLIDEKTVEQPVSSISCHCLFRTSNSNKEIEEKFRYQFYVDFNSSTSFKLIEYRLNRTRMKLRFLNLFRHDQFFVVAIFFVVNVLLTSPIVFVHLSKRRFQE